MCRWERSWVAAGMGLLLAWLAGGCGAGPTASVSPSDAYLYADTRQLVDFVEEAAQRVVEEGPAAFAEFAREPRWRDAPTYLFVYDLDGTCVFHGANSELVGRNLMGLRDALGKPVIRFICEVGRRPEPEASGWVFYQWEEQTEFQPSWKSSYIRKAVDSTGKVYAVGSGSSRLKVEKAFVNSVVDSAADLLQREGTRVAFSAFREPSSRFYFLHTFVYVLDEHGRSLVDPAYPTLGGRDMTGFRDASGRYIVREMLEKLKSAEAAWIEFTWPHPGEMLPARKLMYMRRVQVEGRTLLVGSDFYLASPLWMRS